MRRPAVFFDRDNTLIVGHDYIGDPARVQLIAGAAVAVAKCRSLGFAVVVVSNQSGVARGMFEELDVRAVNRKLDALLLASNGGAVIDRHEYCPYHPDAKISAYKQDSFLRKPKPGMILAAAEAMALDLANSWMIGDAPRDIAAGHSAGCRTVLIVDPSLTPSPAALEKNAVAADFVVGSLIQAVEVIADQVNKPQVIDPIADTLPEISASPVNHSNDDEPLAIEPTITPAEIARPSDDIVTGMKNALPSPKELFVDSPAQESTQAPAALDASRSGPSRLELIGQQILMELKKSTDLRHDDFSLSKLVAGIVQIMAVAILPLAYVMYRSDMAIMQAWLLAAIFLQMLTIAMLIMGRQR